MRTLSVVQRGVASFMVVTAAWATALSDAPAADGTEVGQAAAAAQKDLDASLRELTALRETIAAEKLPLNRKLAQLEERLAELRRRNEDTLRALDTGSLDFTGSRARRSCARRSLATWGICSTNTPATSRASSTSASSRSMRRCSSRRSRPPVRSISPMTRSWSARSPS